MGITEYKRTQISNTGKIIEKTDRTICKTLQSQKNNFNKYNQTGVVMELYWDYDYNQP